VRLADILHYHYLVVVEDKETLNRFKFFKENLHTGTSYAFEPETEHKVKRLFKDGGLEFWQRFLLSAKRSAEYEEFSNAVAEAVTALVLCHSPNDG
jgi:hypothetical protein